MKIEDEGRIETRIYTRPDKRTVIEQATGSAVVLSAEQIMAVIDQLHACYDYCAAWKEPTQQSDEVQQ
jgi:hypothetical protein